MLQKVINLLSCFFSAHFSSGHIENLLFTIWHKISVHLEFNGHNHLQMLQQFHLQQIRLFCCSRYSYAIPCQEIVEIIKEYGKIIEIGCGLGYWANILHHNEIDIIAVDTMQEWGNSTTTHFDIIKEDGVKYLVEHDGCSDRTLFLCWSRDADGFVKKYKGDTIIVIGEMDGGCTWSMTDRKNWQRIRIVQMPTWPEIHDCLMVYKRTLSSFYSIFLYVI